MGINTVSVGRCAHTIKRENRKPFLPIYSLRMLLQSPETPVGNPLIDAVCEAIVTEQFTTAKEVAEYLDLVPDQLNNVMKIFTGCTLGDVVSAFVLVRVQTYLDEHPDETLDQVARGTGYKSKSAIAALFKKHNLSSPRSEKPQK